MATGIEREGVGCNCSEHVEGKRDELRMKFDAMDAEAIQQQSSNEHDNTTPV